jgi:hypothetical protein
VCMTADSHRNRSRLHRLSFAWPRTVSQDGPFESGAGGHRAARIRRTTSLLMGMPKAKAICCAIRGQPQLGFRRFMSTMAATVSWLGPFGLDEWWRSHRGAAADIFLNELTASFFVAARQNWTCAPQILHPPVDLGGRR